MYPIEQMADASIGQSGRIELSLRKLLPKLAGPELCVELIFPKHIQLLTLGVVVNAG